ncbi:cutinase-domain-containing protein [Aspergillus egyptiacus]|nr:cutinase-domain-containing protein [Aspergillus egyptiacus]
MNLRALLLTSLATLATASPLPDAESGTLERRQISNANDLENGICKPVSFIFARGSTESGNMGYIIGPQVCANLKLRLGSDNVACQGVGGAYTASLIPNFFPENTNQASIDEAVDMFQLAENCPGTQIVAGGYSQGSAVISGAIQDMSDSLRDMVKGVVLFGYTRNLQDLGRIPGYPRDQTEVFCNLGDLVCVGTLVITASHLTYGTDASEAGRFLASMLD